MEKVHEKYGPRALTGCSLVFVFVWFYPKVPIGNKKDIFFPQSKFQDLSILIKENPLTYYRMFSEQTAPIGTCDIRLDQGVYDFEL